ncbi:MAG TPA: D-aminoacylase [Roseiflexaceae bacterium]|nr:D-aminoacylase [Roseiflexaceae bacterium]
MPFDVLIRGGRVVDGSGNPWFYGDVALAGERVAAVTPPGRIPAEQARETVDAAGMVVCPGFIDIQSHSILPLMIDGRSLSKVTQGVTTEIMGEAWTPAPFGGRIADPMDGALFTHHAPGWPERARTWRRLRDWLEALIAHGVTPNVGSFLGGGTLRRYACGMRMGVAEAGELDIMRRVMAEAMEDGAFGVSYALIYPPDAFTETDELIEVCKVVARYGGVYITHIRSEGAHLLEGITEAIDIGRIAGLPVEIYHLKASGRDNWHKLPEVIRMVEAARASGLDVTADMYPYAASGTGLTAVLPPWADADGKLYQNLANPQVRARIRAELLHPAGDWEAMVAANGPEAVMPVGFELPEHRQYVGRRLSEIAAMRGQEWPDAVMDLLLAERQRISTIYFTMSEENVRMQLRLPWIKVATDAGGLDPAWAAGHGPVHPRAYGTFPRVLGRYVREAGLLELEDAVRKMTSAVADRLGLRARGLLRAGCFADVVVFDPQAIADRATFEDSHQLSTGVRDVWVNGVQALRDGEHTGATPGRIVEGPGRAWR